MRARTEQRTVERKGNEFIVEMTFAILVSVRHTALLWLNDGGKLADEDRAAVERVLAFLPNPGLPEALPAQLMHGKFNWQEKPDDPPAFKAWRKKWTRNFRLKVPAEHILGLRTLLDRAVFLAYCGQAVAAFDVIRRRVRDIDAIHPVELLAALSPKGD